MGSGRVVDEAVGLSATFKDAPGYTEATQFLKEKTNKEKGIKVDRAFKPAFVKALQGDFSDVKSYNKKARDFKKKNPKVDVPIIRIDKNLDVSKVVKHYKNFSPEAQKNIKDIYNKTGVVVQTDSKPLGQLVKEFRRANLLKKGVKATALAGLGLTAAGAAMAGDKLSDATGISKSYLYGESATPQLQTAGPGVETAVGAGATGAAFIPKVRESVGKLTQKIPAPVRKVGGAVLNRVILPAFVGMSAYDLADKSRYETPAEYAATVAQQPLDFLGLGFIADKARENLRMRRYATPEELKQLDQTPGITDYTEIPSQMDKSQLKSSLLERALRKEFGTQGYFDPNARDVFVDTGDEPIEVIPEATKRYMKRKQEGLGAFEDIYGP